MSEEKNISATLILEILGKPAEHLVQVLEEIIKKMGEEKGVEVVHKKINKPALARDSKELYTTFAEVEIRVERLMHVAALVFKYMPAHVEINEPEKVAMSNNEWGEIFSEITRRLHGYDEVARVLQNERAILEKKLKEMGIEIKRETKKEEVKEEDGK